jgi:hypothetical protein
MNPPRCPHCRKLFQPEPHNAWHQRCCTREACQLARNRESCREWRRNHPDYFKNYSGRVRDWRDEHPGYWRDERRKAFSADILIPVHRGGSNGLGIRIRGLDGYALQHVVIAKTRNWLGVWRAVGYTLQNIVHGLGFRPYRRGHEQDE